MDKDLEHFEDTLLQLLEDSIPLIQNDELKKYAARLSADLYVVIQARIIKEN
jgi:hypothetical protein